MTRLRSDSGTRTHSITERSLGFALPLDGGFVPVAAFAATGEAACERRGFPPPSAERRSPGDIQHLHPAGTLAQRARNFASAATDQPMHRDAEARHLGRQSASERTGAM